jgi:hypothetical protein
LADADIVLLYVMGLNGVSASSNIFGTKICEPRADRIKKNVAILLYW